MAPIQPVADYSTKQERVSLEYGSESSLVNATEERTTLAEVEIIHPRTQQNNSVDKIGTPLEQIYTSRSNAKAECSQETPDVATKADPKSELNHTDNRRNYLELCRSRELNIVDPYECSKNDPNMVSEYVMDVYEYLKTMENDFSIREGFLDNHGTTPWMRAKLIDWLVGVHNFFNMYSDSLHLCVAIVDEFLQANTDVGGDTIQLVGISALLVSSKYEEVLIPKLKYFEHICAYVYSREQIRRMEVVILRQVDFRLGRALSVQFLRRYNLIAQVQSDHYCLGEFVLEIAFLEHEMSHVKPSIQAAAACCLTMEHTSKVDDLSKLWTPALVRYTGYEFSDFEDIMISFSDLLDRSESSEFQNVIKKYVGSS